MATYRARILASAAGVAVNNTLHVSSTGTPVEGIASDLANAWRQHFVPLLASTYSFQGVELENIATEDASVFSSGTVGVLVGGDTATPMPTWACASVRFSTGMRGRAGAGRLGLGPIGEGASDATGNTLTALARTNIQNAVGAFRTDIESSGGTTPMVLAVVSYYKGVDLAGKPIKRNTPLINAVTGHSVNSVIGTRLGRHPNR